ncbi:hypothetical protein [Methylophaga sp.]|uniref:hypothetical protein n=1 Tax=Methylophaga sp. TaxID=2024840 RepID=UPI0027187D40|nr:hypothetical protein [Methylophaga sp.]MDO8826962.1 hypothetical protein [Methylophaga sp.]
MNPPRLFVLRLLIVFSFAWATSVFAGDDCVNCGTELSVNFEKKVDPEVMLLICAGFNAGQLDSARNNGIKFYGSVENFYSQMHQIQCPTNAPSPIYDGVDFAPAVDGYTQMFRDLAKLPPEVRARLLNRPTSGRRKETILDLLDRRMKFAAGADNVVTLYQDMRVKFIELGAKKVSEMTPEELAIYK